MIKVRASHVRQSPVFHLIAWPNGAGKTTFATLYLPRYAGTIHFINADLIAAGLSPLRPESAALSAGKLLLSEFERLASKRELFAAETTFAGTAFLDRLARLRDLGYRLRLYFLWLESEALAVARVAERVRRGGHSVPEAIIRRRYAAGIERLRSLDVKSFDHILVFDNSGLAPRPVANWRGGLWTVRDAGTWAKINGKRP